MAQSLFILVGGLLTLAVLFLHPIGPALVLIALFPFDAIFYGMFGVMGNLVTVILVLAFLIRTSPRLWSTVWLGTRLQLVIAVFALCLFISHAMAIPYFGYGLLYEYLRKIVRFAMVGIFVWSLAQPRYVPLCLKLLVTTMAAFTVLAAADYYLGIKILPASGSEWGTAGALAQDIGEMTAWRFRFNAPGLTDPNSYANALLLPILLSIGWFLSRDKQLYRGIALGSGLLMVMAMLATVSRSGIGALAIGALVLLPLIFRVRPLQVAVFAIVGIALPMLAWFVLAQVGLDQSLAERFSAEEVEGAGGFRILLMRIALEIFANNPILGVGETVFRLHSPRAKVVHNAYLSMLAERGLVGFIPFAIILWLSIRQLLRNHSRVAPAMDHWRPYILAGLVAVLAQCVLNDFTWARPLWFCVAFAAALERYEALAARSRRVEQAAPPEPGFEPPAPPEPTASSGGFY